MSDMLYTNIIIISIYEDSLTSESFLFLFILSSNAGICDNSKSSYSSLLDCFTGSSIFSCLIDLAKLACICWQNSSAILTLS